MKQAWQLFFVGFVAASITSASTAHGDTDLLLRPTPTIFTVADITRSIHGATVSDVEVADFTGDGRLDVAVAWYITPKGPPHEKERVLTIFRNTGSTLALLTEIDLFGWEPGIPPMSTFWNGTADLGTGDFDGDGDVDLAATAFFGDELLLIENLGNGSFAVHDKFPYGISTPGNPLTPPELIGADFDGDGRDELVYICDPINHWDGYFIHFYRTSGSIAEMYRVDWQGIEGAEYSTWFRGLAVADFDGDGKADLCFTGAADPPQEEDPILTIWYDLDTTTRRFAVQNYYPDFICSDVAAVRLSPGELPGVLLTDRDGTTVHFWRNNSDGLALQFADEEFGYPGLSPNRGMTAVVADVDGDGVADLVTKQKLGLPDDDNQIDVTLGRASGSWTRVSPTPLDTSGFLNDPNNEILRPRNLAVADLWGNVLPEIIAGFGPRPGSTDSLGTLDIAVWNNGCIGDVNRDGVADGNDAVLVAGAKGSCLGDPEYLPDADVDKDGCITRKDARLVLFSAGCGTTDCAGQVLGDANCDGALDARDVDGFVLALTKGRAHWESFYGDSGCAYFCVNDMNSNGAIDGFDISLFRDLILEP